MIPKVYGAMLACCLACATYAGEPQQPTPDIGDELARARKAATLAESLGAQARRGGKDLMLLLEKQESAYEQADQAYSAALKKDPGHPHALAEYGRYCLARSRYTHARARLQSALDNPRAESAFTPADKADILRTLGGLLERAGDIGQALAKYQQAAAFDPTNPRNRLSLGIALCAAGRPHETAVILKPWAKEAKAALDFPSKSPSIHALGIYTLALALEETGYLEDALAQYGKSLDLARLAGAAETAGVAERADMAIARLEDLFDGLKARDAQCEKENAARKEKKLEPLPLEREQYARAAYRCDEGIKLKSMALSEDKFNEVLSRMRGSSSPSAALNEEFEKHPAYDSFVAAMQAFQDSVSLVRYMKVPRAHYELGLCNLLAGRFGAARTHLELAANYSPNNLSILNLYGDVLLELGQWEEAAAAYRKLLSLEPESGPANFGLARAYAASQADLRQCQAALDALDRAVNLGLRDKRIFQSHLLVQKDGRELEGQVTEQGNSFLLHRGAAQAMEIPKAGVKEVIRRPGMRDQLAGLIERFERGERPASGPVLRGPKSTKPAKPASGPDPWSGTIFEQ